MALIAYADPDLGVVIGLGSSSVEVSGRPCHVIGFALTPGVSRTVRFRYNTVFLTQNTQNEHPTIYMRGR